MEDSEIMNTSANHCNAAWYLIYSKPRAEQHAYENLARQGFQVYLPLIRASHRRRSRYVTVVEPMFSRYLFIKLNSVTDNWSPIRSTLGVASMVKFGGIPAQVPSRLITALKAGEDESGVQQLPVEDFQVGDRVRIIEGPMTGFAGVYQAQTSKDRSVILLDIVGRHSRVMVSRHQLQICQ